jgi:SWI/SNF-related matrix-associated actin-dependent regulator 1 of chromatin subfamily A
MIKKDVEIQLYRSKVRGFTEVECDYHPDLVADLKGIPGAKWNPHIKRWLVPTEMLPAIGAEQVDQKVINGFEPHPKLYEYQVQSVANALTAGRFFLYYEMGLGKTPTAIDFVRQLDAKKILVVCPALVRLDFEAAFDEWWPEHPPVDVIQKGTELDTCKFDVVIISYKLLEKLPKVKWDAIILDECHYIKNFKAGRSKHVKKLLENNPDVPVLGLTGTPITNQPKDIYNLVDTFFPGRFGGYSKFCRRYCNLEANPYSALGFNATGLNPDSADEIHSRLTAIGDRVTKKDVAHLLPPITMSITRFKGDRVQFIVDSVREAQENGITHICVLTHLRETAEQIDFALGNAPEICRVDGSTPAGPRVKKINSSKSWAHTTLIATMHSVNVGIDLTEFTQVFFAEMYSAPAIMLQAVGRFNRLSSKAPVNVQLCCEKGSDDERMSRNLKKKVEDISAAIGEGHSEELVSDAFVMTEEQEQEFLSELRDLVG